MSDCRGEAVLFSDRAGRTFVGMSVTGRFVDRGLYPIGSEVQKVTLSSFIDRELVLLKMNVEGVEPKVI